MPFQPISRRRAGTTSHMAKRARPQIGRADRKTRRPDRQPMKAAAPPPAPVVIRQPPAPPAPPPGPNPEGVRLFQAGMEALQRHDYSGAANSFRTLLDRFPSERALLDRARVYLDLCEREL